MTEATTAPKVSGGWMVAGGAAIAIAGLFMLIFPVSASVSVTLMAGWALMFAGVVGFIGALTDRSGGGMLVAILLRVLAVVAGAMLVFNPLAGTVTLTMVFVYWLLADGILGTVLSIVNRGQAWGWWLASSLFSVVLALLLLGTMPLSAGWILGTYVGIVLLMRGMLLVGAGFAARSVQAG